MKTTITPTMIKVDKREQDTEKNASGVRKMWNFFNGFEVWAESLSNEKDKQSENCTLT